MYRLYKTNKKSNALLCMLVAMAGLILLYSSASQAKVVDRIVAVVNGDIITQTDLDAKLRSSTSSKKTTLNDLALEQARRNALDELIDDLLLKQAIDKSKIEITQDEVSKAINNILKQNRMTISQLRSEIARKGMAFKEYEDQLKTEIKKIKFINQVVSSGVKVSNRDLRDYFDQNKATIHGNEKAHIAEIILPIAEIRTEEEAIALRNNAFNIVKQSRENPSSFEKLAKQHSKGPNSENGGDLGTVKLNDLPETVARAIQSLPEGGISDPIPTENAVVIVKLIEWPDVSDKDFESMRDVIYEQIHQQKLQDALNAYIQMTKQQSYIEIR